MRRPLSKRARVMIFVGIIIFILGLASVPFVRVWVAVPAGEQRSMPLLLHWQRDLWSHSSVDNWPRMQAVLDQVGRFRAQQFADTQAPDFWSWEPRWISPPDIPVVDWTSPSDVQLARRLLSEYQDSTAYSMLVRKRFQASGIQEAIDLLPTDGRYTWKGGVLAEDSQAMLSDVRTLTRLLRAQCNWAIEQGHVQEAIRCVRRMMTIASILSRQYGANVGFSGVQIAAVATHSGMRIVMLMPLTRDERGELQRLLTNERALPRPIDMIRLAKDMCDVRLDIAYSLDSSGNGVPSVHGLKRVLNRPYLTFPSALVAKEAAFGPSRWTMEELVDRHYDELKKSAIDHSGAPSRWPSMGRHAQSWFWPIVFRELTGDGAYLINAFGDLELEREALELALAIARFRDSAHCDPCTMEDLVPEFLAVAPEDPKWRSPLRIRRGCGRFGGFLIYADGADGLDDGGREDRDHPGMGDSLHGRGVDVILFGGSDE